MNYGYDKRVRSIIILLVTLVLVFIKKIPEGLVTVPYVALLFIWDFIYNRKSEIKSTLLFVFFPCSLVNAIVYGLLFSFKLKLQVFAFVLFLLFFLIFFYVENRVRK